MRIERTSGIRSIATSRGCTGAATPCTQLDDDYETDNSTPSTRPDPVARQHHWRAVEERRAVALHRRALGHGLTSNPTIFDHAIRSGTTSGDDISAKNPVTKSAEELFFELALADLTRAVGLFQPVFART